MAGAQGLQTVPGVGHSHCANQKCVAPRLPLLMVGLARERDLARRSSTACPWSALVPSGCAPSFIPASGRVRFLHFFAHHQASSSVPFSTLPSLLSRKTFLFQFNAISKAIEDRKYLLPFSIQFYLHCWAVGTSPEHLQISCVTPPAALRLHPGLAFDP